MASPSSFEGLSKIQIKQRLTEMRKQYELMQKKLEKSEKAAKAKSHVKKKIADYKRNQLRGGSPECTVKAPQQQDVELLQEKSLLSSASRRDGQLSGCDKTGSNKKIIKRRSVSFHLTDRTKRDQLSKSKEDTNQSTTNDEAGIRTPCGEGSNDTVSDVGSPAGFVERTRNLFDQDPYTLEKSLAEKKEVHLEPPALHADQSKQFSENAPAKMVSEGYARTVKDGSPKVSRLRYDLSSDEAISSEKASTEEGFSQQTNIQTPPEDTQFDLFADTSPEILDMDVKSTCYEASHKNTLQVKHLMSDVSQPLDKNSFQCDNRKVVKNLDVSLSMNTGDGLDSARDEISSQSSHCVLDFDNRYETGKMNEIHATKSDPSACKLLERTVVESSEEQYVKYLQTGVIMPQENLVENVGECISSSVEDLDVIPGTYSEEVQVLPKSAQFEARNNQRQSGAALERVWTKRMSTEGQTPPLKELQDEQELKDTSCAQVLKPSGEHPKQQDQQEVEMSETNVAADDVISKASEDVTKTFVETNLDSKGTSKGRRKSQRSIDNLSMDDVSLKDFVLSQQTSQEGTHSWIDGLMYPAEYYVRKTRSMSKPSPDNHSAPVGNHRYPSNQSRSRSVERPFFSDPLIQGGANQSVTMVNETLTSKDTMSSQCPEAFKAMQTEPYVSSNKAGKESTSAGKMKVSRTSAASQKRRGRPPKARRKVEHGGIHGPVEKNQDVAQSKTGVTEDNQSVKYLTKSKGMDRESNENSCKEPTVKEARSDEVLDAGTDMSKGYEKLSSTQVSHNPLESQFTQLEIPSVIPMPRLFGSPETQSRKGIERITSTYPGGHNPLESQFTQIQIPSEFALPTVFGSPGNQSQIQNSLQLGTQSSPFEKKHGNEIGSPLEAKAISHQERNPQRCDVNEQVLDDVYLQGHPEHQWESQAYLADMVPTATEPNCPDPGSVHAASTILFQEDNDCKGTPILQEQGCEIASQLSQSVLADIRRASQNSDVSMVSLLSQENATDDPDGAHIHQRPVEPLPKDRHVILPDDPSKGDLRTGLLENLSLTTTSVPSVTTMASALDTGVQVDNIAIPSSLCSNVDQGSPYTDAATGTPPEVADIPQVQSQCTYPLRYSLQDEEVEQEERLGGGIGVKGTSMFLFRGCLEHTIKETTPGIVSLTSSSVVINDVKRNAIAVQCSSDIFIWLQDFKEGEPKFKLLSSWAPEKIDEEIHLVRPYSGAEGCFEAVVIIRDGSASESIRLIQLDIHQDIWQESVVWTSIDLGQRSCTALCLSPDGWIAVAASDGFDGSDILYSRLDELCQSEPEVLPAVDEHLNSLSVVESSPDMMVGLTNMKALLWHLPTCQLVQEFSLATHDVTNCIQATAESGLLFLVAYKKESDRQHAKLSEDRMPSCCLLALNPVTGRSSKLLNYTAPSMKPETRIVDVSVLERTLAACLSTGHICIWDLCSSELLTSSQSDSDHRASLVTLQDKGSMLLACGDCVQIFEREPSVN